jgi:hypothetical protein
MCACFDSDDKEGRNYTLVSVSSGDENTLKRLWMHAYVIKLIIPNKLHGMLRHRLKMMNIRDIVLFPDMDGALAHISSVVPQSGR